MFSRLTRAVIQVIAKETAKHMLSVEFGLKQKAQAEALAYIESRMSGAQFCADRFSLYRVAMEAAPAVGSVMEFGVYRGYSINYIASLTERTVHGFDSFEGLPERWAGLKLGHFSLNGKLPRVRKNVVLHKGWFDATVQNAPKGPVAFLHIDCDLYSSTKTVLTGLADRLGPGLVIVFDEYFNYIGWREHEFKAFQEFGRPYSYLAYSGKGQVAVVLS